MCGFAGAVVWDERYRVSPETLRRMSAAVAHRGPDGEGLRLTREHEPITPATPQVALGFRRLAILDTGVRSMQPFTDGRRWLVFNGEIYNFRDLRAELSDGDRQWRTTGDTEVLLAAYAAWGERCVDRLNGMFAFAVWDEVDRTLFLARDRMGQKPLYFAAVDACGKAWSGVPATTADGMSFDAELVENRGRLGRRLRGDAPAAIAFASELSALITVPWFNSTTLLSQVGTYLASGYGTGIETIYTGGQRLPPSCWFRTTAIGFESAEYFRPIGDAVSDSAAVSQTRRLVGEAVRRQLVADVPLGCFLSGGVDSSVVVAAIRSLGLPVQTFSIGFDDPRYDERGFARAVAEHLGTTHHEFHVTPNAADDLPRLAATFAEPFGDSSALPTHYLARETRAVVKVALSGDGGDELFGGYDRYRAMRLTHRFAFAFETASAVGVTAGLKRYASPGRKGRVARVGRLFATFVSDPAARYAGIMRLFDRPTIAELMPGLPVAALEYDAVRYEMWRYHVAKKMDVVRAAIVTDRQTYLPDDLLVKTDRCSMLHGLEVRSPFMDHELVQFAAGLTTDQLLKDGPKRMLREAFAADLPAWVFKRKKMGFAVPIGDWFRGPLRAMLHDTLFAAGAFGRSHFDMAVVRRLVDEHESGRVDHAQRLYALLMLELWWVGVRPA